MIKEYLESMIKLQGKYIDKLDSVYSSNYDFVLKNGVECKPQAFDRSKFPGAPTKKRECFRNAWLLSEWFNLIYVEGYAFGGIIITEHAWCVDEDLNVYDPTWENPR